MPQNIKHKQAMLASFPEFLWIWNQSQNLQTPNIHQNMAQWLNQNSQQPCARLLLQAFRGSGKSTLCGLLAAWSLYLKPHIRIMILAAEHHLATKMVRNIKHTIEHHPLIHQLKPQQPEQWASAEFTVNRNAILRDPSVVAHGISGNFTGSRADLIICDDVEVPNNCDNPKKRESLREKLSEIDYVMTTQGNQIYIGTPHSYYSIYAEKTRREINETKTFLHNFNRLNIPLLNENAQSNWPEKFSQDYISLLQTRQGPNKFNSQMMLKPIAPKAGILNPDLLQYYNGQLKFSENNGVHQLSINNNKLISSSAWWDPAFAINGDNSVIACIFSDQQGQYYLHDILYIKPNPEINEDNARQQCRQVAQFLNKNYQTSINVETNGIGKFLPGLLRQILEQEKINAAVIEHHSAQNKNSRILTAFDALLAAQQLNINQNITNTPFITEMREWNNNSADNNDDALDAVAGCINNEPTRLPRQFKSFSKPAWKQWQNGLQAHTQFKI